MTKKVNRKIVKMRLIGLGLGGIILSLLVLKNFYVLGFDKITLLGATPFMGLFGGVFYLYKGVNY